MSETPKGCPWCQTEAGVVYRVGRYAVACDTWGCHGSLAELSDSLPFESAADAIAAWNRRADPWVPVGERLPALEDFVLLTIERKDGSRFVSGGWLEEEPESVSPEDWPPDGCEFEAEWSCEALMDGGKVVAWSELPLPAPPEAP